MIEEMNGCSRLVGEANEACGGKDFSISTSDKGTDVEAEIRCNVCGDTQIYKKPRLEFIKPMLIDEHNSRHIVE